MKILLTGGHFSPAHSIIAELKTRGHQICVAGRRHPFEGDKSISFEYEVCQKEKLDFYEIRTGRFQRKFTAYTLSSLLKTPLGFFGALAILRRAKPDVVVTFGGYIGLPIAYAAATLKIPVILHEQTQASGLSSKLIANIAAKVCISFESSAKHFPEAKTVFTGNPVRQELFQVDKKINLPENEKIIYVTGGSTGSHFINMLIEKSLDGLLAHYVIIHQTGDSAVYNDFERLTSLKSKLSKQKNERYILRKFIYPEEIGSVFKCADLIVSRAGANTIMEIIAMKKVSLLIPLPHGQTSEQLENAHFIKSLKIGEYLEQKNADRGSFLSLVSEIFLKKKDYESHMSASSKYYIPGAAMKIVDIIEQYGKKSS